MTNTTENKEVVDESQIDINAPTTITVEHVNKPSVVETSISLAEQRKIARALEKHHAIFERIWERGRIRFSNKKYKKGKNAGKRKGPVASVAFNVEGKTVDFFVDYDFWNSISFERKCFTIAHECSHIALKHGSRQSSAFTYDSNGKLNGIDKRKNKINNFAQDIVINHALVNRYGFLREECDPENKYCWVDTIFQPVINHDTEEVTLMPDYKNFEFYVNEINKLPQKEMDENEQETVDDHSSMGSGMGDEDEDDGDGDGDGGERDEVNYTDDFSEIIEELNEELSFSEKKSLQKFIEDNESNEEEEVQGSGEGEEKSGGSNLPSPSQGRGKGRGGQWIFAKKTKIVHKKKWEHIVTNWAKKRLVDDFKEQDQWVFTNRRFMSLMQNRNDSLMLPSEYEIQDRNSRDSRINAWFFQDTSGSCSGYRDRFFSIAAAMPEDKFHMRFFCFDDDTYETTIESGKLYGFGGTSFDIIEARIQKEIRNGENVKYPDAVFIVTDGLGNNVTPEKPKNWHWILTPNGDTRFVHNDSKKYDLEEYE